jgi:hypothetical protein
MSLSTLKRARNTEGLGKTIYQMGQKGALLEIREILTTKPQNVHPLLLALEKNMMGGARGKMTLKQFEEGVDRINQVPKEWVAQILMDICPAFRANNGRLLEKIDDFDSLALRKLLDYACGTVMHWLLGYHGHDPRVLRKVLLERAATLGHRLSGDWVNRFINPNTGEINWKAGGCFRYQLNVDGDKVDSTFHCTGRQDIG